MSGKQDSDIEGTVLLFIVITVLIFVGFQYAFVYLAEFWRILRMLEFYMFSWVPEWVPIFGDLKFAMTAEYFSNLDSKDITPEFIKEVDQLYGKHLSWIPAGILGFLGAKLVMKTENVSQVFSMESLLKRQAPFYPFVQKFLTASPEKMDLIFKRGSKESKDFAIALTPERFAKMNPPLGLEKEVRKKYLPKKSIWDGGIDFDDDLAERAFIKQLGKRFSGMSSLSSTENKLFNDLKGRMKTTLGEHQKFIQMTFKKAIKLRANNKDVNDLIKNMPESDIKAAKQIFAFISDKKFVKSGSKATVALRDGFFKDNKKIFIERKCIQLLQNHAYTRTGLMSILEEARNGGVVPSLEFRHWLKGEDRVLWYCVSTVGRRVSFVESAGAFAHWLLELEVGKPIPQPFVDEAVEGLKIALKMNERIALYNDKIRSAS